MKQKRNYHLRGMIMLCLFLIIPALSFAAGNTDFTGEWTLNNEKSELGEGRFFSPLRMTVKQEEVAITIDRTTTGRDGEERTISQTLTMDGKENKMESERRNSITFVTWSEDGSALTIKADSEFSRQGEVMKIKSEEIWTLEGDGKILKIQSSMSSPRGDRAVTLVYDKK
jgi:hypothetical protein